MKKKEMHITFHNPNNAEDSQKLAEAFITKVAEGAIGRYVTEQDKISAPIKSGLT